MPGLRRRPVGPALVAVSISFLAVLWPAAGSAQNAVRFSPTFAASQGSPYRDVSGPTSGAGAATDSHGLNRRSAPSTAFPEPAGREPGAGAHEAVVYVIEDGRLLTYSASDYAAGRDRVLARTDLSRIGAIIIPEVRVPTIADRLYAGPPLETAGGEAGSAAPVVLIPPRN
jgi:hypothetical protein